MSVLVNLAMFPTDTGSSLSTPVSKVIELIKNSGAQYQLGPMGTTIETKDMAEALDIIHRAHSLLEQNHDRIYTTITIDARKGDVGRMQAKVQSIENNIGKVNT